jgi:hypothetical protein
MKRYDAWSEPDPQCGFGGGRCELYERTLGQYVAFDDHEREVSALRAELARVKTESLRVVHDTQRCYFYMTPSGIGWHSEDRFKNQCVETPTDYHDFADCKPVRLERWEEE